MSIARGSSEIVRVSEITSTTPITIQTSEQQIALSVHDVLRWVAPDAPEPEALKFLMVCRARGLNPLLGEAHLVPFGPKWQTVVDKSGYLKLLEEHPQYDGHEAGIIVRDYDSVAKRPIGPEKYLEGSYRPKECLLVGGWAKVYRKDRPDRPAFAAISAEEYNKGSGSYQTIPCTMLRKVALVHAAAESGLINAPRGLTPEEAPEPIYSDYPEPIEISGEALEAEYSQANEPLCPPAYAYQIIKLRDQLGIPESSFEWRDAMAKRGVSAVADLTAVQAQDLISRLSGLLPHPDFAPDQSPEAQADLEQAAESFEFSQISRTPKKGEEINQQEEPEEENDTEIIDVEVVESESPEMSEVSI